MSALDIAERSPLFQELVLPVTDFGYAGAVLLGVGCFVAFELLVRLPVRHAVSRTVRDAFARAALISLCWAALSISLASAWEFSP
ncbi:hypothetical protein ACIBCA_36405 [Kitasatospora sp. NPDC051170]|uniref:hypothetical protein n=1 Tax=Kitasatospora sp. NPDC051170 TaxID=3364056 RepID=UPI0037B8DDED